MADAVERGDLWHGLAEELVGDQALAALIVRHYDFFFSSRRRHTRCSRDWSSDVCSSDLARLLNFSEQISTAANSEIYAIAQSAELEVLMATYPDRSDATQYEPAPRVIVDRSEIGRASCRERV